MKMEAIKLKDTYYTNNAPYRVRLKVEGQKPKTISLFGFIDIPVTSGNTMKDLDGEYIIITVQGSSLIKHLDNKDLIRLQLSKGDKWVYIGDYHES